MLETLLSRAGLAFLALLALIATCWFQDSLWRSAPIFGAPWLGWAGWCLPAAMAALAWGLGRRAAPAWLGSGRAAWLGLAAIALTRLLAAWWLDAPLVNDFAEYHQLAIEAAQGGKWFSELRPMGYPLMLAAAYALVGPQVWAAELVNVACGLAAGALLYGLVRRSWGATAGGAALWLYAAWPAAILMTPVVGTELAYGAAFLAALWLGLEAARGRLALAVAAGVVLGLSQYIRPTSLALLPVWLALPLLARRPLRQAAPAAIAIATTFLLVLAPVAHYNLEKGGTLSFSTSNWGGWSLLVGANQQHLGAWNPEDAAMLSAHADVRARDRVAKELAIARIAADPVGYAWLLVRKLPVMWGSEHYAAYWVWGTREPVPLRRMWLAMLVCQAFYLVALWAACWGFRRARPVREPAMLAIVASWGLVAGLHLVMEVQSRYHFYVVPTFFVAAALVFARGSWVERRVSPALSPPGPVGPSPTRGDIEG